MTGLSSSAVDSSLGEVFKKCLRRWWIGFSPNGGEAIVVVGDCGAETIVNPGVNPVALGLEDKKAIVADVSETAAQALSLVIADARGCTVSQMTQLRKLARESKVYVRVVRNTLARRAVEGTAFECAQSAFKGPSLLAFSMEDPGAAARIFKDFAKANEKFGQLLGAEQIDRLATLPTREQALGMLAGILQAPISKFARTLNEVPSGIARAIAAVRDQKAA
jgi:large subunit ribosomal protein L10